MAEADYFLPLATHYSILTTHISILTSQFSPSSPLPVVLTVLHIACISYHQTSGLDKYYGIMKLEISDVNSEIIGGFSQ